MTTTKEQIEALARALRRSIPSPMHNELGHAEWAREKTTAILAALDGWTLVPTADSLDAAWAEAEAALPEGWVVRLEGGLDHTYASAFGYQTGRIDCPADTPAAALRALAARLHILAPKADPSA